MIKRKALDEASSAAERLLDALNRRDIDAAYKFRDLILLSPSVTPEMWISGDPSRVAPILYAIAQILSRYCLHSNDPHGRQCQFKRLDRLLELNHGSETSASSAICEFDGDGRGASVSYSIESDVCVSKGGYHERREECHGEE